MPSLEKEDLTPNISAEPPPEEQPLAKKAFPKDKVILDKDGKPCRTCTSFRDWTKKTASTQPPPQSSTPNTPPPSLPADCPPDVEALGRSTWTLLHTVAATYPSTATPAQQGEMETFISLFSRIYPCWVCAEDFRGYIQKPENKLTVEGGGRRGHLSGRGEFGLWMCNAHNDVNRKLGKKVFDCSKWEERWRTGWKDGSCD